MRREKEIFSLVAEKEREAERTARQGLIIQPGALGDCILTLPLANFLKTSLDLGTLTVMGNMEYIGALLGRTCVNKIRSLEGAGIHRLFEARGQFKLEDKDPLLKTLMPYSWIITFLGESGSDFEHNLLFTANCTHAAEVATVGLKAPSGYEEHISQFYIDELCREMPWLERQELNLNETIIACTHNDTVKAQMLLDDDGIEAEKFVLMAPGAGAAAKCWGVENFAACAEAVQDAGYKCVFVIGPVEVERNNIDTAVLEQFGPVVENPQFSQLLGLCSQCKCYVGNDSGVSHLAGAAGAATIAIFGPTEPLRYRPLGPRVEAVKVGEHAFGKANEEQQRLIVAKILKLLDN